MNGFIYLCLFVPTSSIMAQLQQRIRREIRFRSVQLFKSHSLGMGSYGAVCKAKCDDLPCAAKLLHPVLFDTMAHSQASPETKHRLPMSRFEQECEFLSSIKHPNIVQYLGTHQDPESKMLVLLMELMDESLNSYLERSQQNLPYHIEITISNDIALALSFLHLNGIIHRDLSSNNVLMIGNSRAKVSDFGMAKLANANLQATRGSLTQAPGSDVYMPPEATKIPPVYSEKIDCFSFGILGIQIMTRQFPNPGDRLKEILIDHPNFPSGNVQVAVSEIERRQDHINLIDQSHPLLVVALDCLKDKEGERPSAHEICGRLAALKDAHQFTQSIQEQATPQQNSDEGAELHVQDTIASEDQRIDEKSRITASKDQEIAAKDESIATYQQEVQQQRQDMETMLQEKATIERSNTEYQQEIHHLRITVREKEHLLETKGSELLRLKQQAEEKERIIVEFQQASLREARRISKLEQQLKLRPSTSSGGAESFSMDLKWTEGRKALCSMYRDTDAVAQGSVLFLRTADSRQVHAYDSTINDWFQLPYYPHESFTLAVVDNLLTAIGGKKAGKYTNTLLTIEGRDRKWVETFPPMPTKRSFSCAVSSEASLIVIGGLQGRGVVLSAVEVMDILTKRWTTVASLPEPIRTASATICGDRVYILSNLTKSVFTCSLSALLQSSHRISVTGSLQAASTTADTSVWSKVADLPVIASTCVTLQGRLLAIGGREADNKPTTAVRVYDPESNAWNVISHMTTPRCWCFAAVLPGNRLMVVGGQVTQSGKVAKTTEVASL